jgi:protein-tyrosine kinase
VLSSSDAEDVGYGFSDVLIGNCQFADAIRPTTIKGVQIIETGTLPPNPAELLATSDVKGLFDQLRQSYDCIILDGPPILLVSDAKVLANYVDAAIIVFNAASTRRGAAQRTILKGGYFQEQFKVYNEYQKKQLAHSV